MTELQIPSLEEREPEAAIREIQRYLRMLHEELQSAMTTVETSITTAQQTGSRAMAAAKAAKETPSQMFGRVKDLIIKSADIVEAYQERMQISLDGRYAAQSDFGVYQEVTNASITANSQRVEQVYTNLSDIDSRIAEIADAQMEMNAYIRTGKLYEEAGVPRYGVEIGERHTVDDVEQFRKYARLTSDKLSFFDANENEVAYVSDRKLHITEADADLITARTIESEMINLGPYSITYGPDGHLTIS